jgi:hypothetical protein
MMINECWKRNRSDVDDDDDDNNNDVDDSDGEWWL